MSFIRNSFVVLDSHWYLALVLFSSLVYMKIQGQVSMLPQGTFPNGASCLAPTSRTGGFWAVVTPGPDSASGRRNWVYSEAVLGDVLP